MKKKVLFITPNLHGGGAERVVVNLLKHIDRDRISPCFMTLSLHGPFVSHLPEDIAVTDLGISQVRYSVIKLVNEINRIQPDVIMSTLMHLNIALLAIKPFLKGNPKIIVREANMPSQELKRRGKLHRLLYKWYYPRADQIIALSNDMKNDILQSNEQIQSQQVTIIHNPVVLHEIRKNAQEQVNHRWLSDKKMPVILNVGRLEEQKDHITLLHSFAIVHQRMDCRMIILGTGSQYERLNALAQQLNIREHIDFAGFVENPYMYMRQSDLFILSSKYEGLPNVLLEAMGLGLPIVSTNCAGVPDVLEEGTYGKVVPIGDAEQLADGIYAKLTSPDPSDFMKLRTHAEKFDIERIVDQYTDLFVAI
ncbi:glycosyltransferase [Paenibacillus sp. OSY-SE]|uniref:glycosyltransferase n=1 Tax=Paenibacillus sp. OSY-SE TaxID=1196323 RepID=UPI0002D2B660|nr:glycosyltransferase [Paenibacillus sp. OSY-SE]